MNPKVDAYLVDGCGRCEYYRTARCKVHAWKEELQLLRSLVLDCGLEEDFKWSQPCYTFRDRNVLLITALRDHAALSFFKGSLLEDPDSILIKPGESSQAGRYLKFTNVEEIVEKETLIKAYVQEAIEAEKAGRKVEFKRNPEPIPKELQVKLNEDPFFEMAFESLTPGRQRGYIIHFSQPKKSETRVSRIEKWMPKILNGEGMHDEYRSRRKEKK